jgi:hypothetical protein
MITGSEAQTRRVIIYPNKKVGKPSPSPPPLQGKSDKKIIPTNPRQSSFQAHERKRFAGVPFAVLRVQVQPIEGKSFSLFPSNK